MSVIKITGFQGEIPRIQSRLLPEAASQYAYNCRLENGALVPFRQINLITSLASLGLSEIQSIYLHGGTWLAWESVVNAAPGPVATDRLYYTGDGVPKMRVGSTVYQLKVTAPTVALSGVASGSGSGDIYTRLYVYTFVTSFGEESEPSPISAEVNWQSGQNITLSGFQAAPVGRSITKQRIYRSQSDSTGNTSLYFIAERNVSTGNYVDSIPLDQTAEVLPSLYYNTPPDNLEGLTALPNGMMVAFVGKDLYFCEPYRPHAWPVKYVLTTDYNIVGLGAYGSTVVILTEGFPYVASGNSPESMVMERIETNLPCVNARGIVDLGYAVAYPSNDGLVVITAGSAQVVTNQIFTRQEWIQINPASLVCAQFSGKYYASYEYTDSNGTLKKGAFIFELAGNLASMIRVQYQAGAMHYSIQNGSLYLLQGSDVYEFDSPSKPNDFMTWRSKLFVMPNPTNFGVIYIDAKERSATEQAAIEAENALIMQQNQELFDTVGSIGSEIAGGVIVDYAIAGDGIQSIQGLNDFASATVYADGEVVAIINKLNQAVRLPSGFKRRNWEIEISGTTEVYEVGMATAAQELKAI